MARTVTITTSSEKTPAVVEEIKKVHGILELHLHNNVSLIPPGDIVTVQIRNSNLQELMRVLDRNDLGKKNGISISTTEPDSVISTGPEYHVDRDTNEGSWEEMEMIISKDSNSTVNTMLLMAVAGSLAMSGIATSTLHIVIAGMLVAPGFMPILRISLGIVAKFKIWHRGLIDIIKNYLALIVGAAITILIFQILGKNIIAPKEEYYQLNKTFITYWSTVTFSSIIASVAASIAGAVLIATKRSVFTSGVMIGLALVPSAAIIPLALVHGNFSLAGGAALRWVTDILIVFLVSFIYLLWEKKRLHKRNMRL